MFHYFLYRSFNSVDHVLIHFELFPIKLWSVNNTFYYEDEDIHILFTKSRLPQGERVHRFIRDSIINKTLLTDYSRPSWQTTFVSRQYVQLQIKRLI